MSLGLLNCYIITNCGFGVIGNWKRYAELYICRQDDLSVLNNSSFY